MKKVYIVLADHTYFQEILGVFKLLKDAKLAQRVEQENFRVSGSFAEIIIEPWDVEQ